ncbi:hypothetical protein QYF61_020308 [Mycteria americana]|uniref:Ig-like domain-containing protein n=1 Tax=Mycteria americana TaxID=33587 RepID=A0AAN7SIW3_MYCAM|nr:hypothetical protein QYF61_020308 [Mycteria americana]
MNSQINLIERNAFDDLTALVELNLAHNNLSSLPHDPLRPAAVPGGAPPAPQPLGLRLRHPLAVVCSAPFIMDAPMDLNISEGRVAELKCRTPSMSSVRWLLPNGTVLSHASSHPRISVLNDGTLNFSHVLLTDTGVYTCMVTNVAGNSNASAYLNVSTAELNTSTTASSPPSRWRPPRSPRRTSPPNHADAQAGGGTTADSGDKMQTSLDEVMKTTKIIIGCFVAVTLLAAAMLIVFYKLRKRHQQRSTVTAARTVEIIQVDEDIPPAATAAATTAAAPAGVSGEGAVVLPAIHDHINYNTYKPAHGAHWTENSLGNSLHPPGTTLSEPYIIQTHTKEKVQETQI